MDNICLEVHKNFKDHPK